MSWWKRLFVRRGKMNYDVSLISFPKKRSRSHGEAFHGKLPDFLQARVGGFELAEGRAEHLAGLGW